ncbi:MAG: hypothetical protein IKW53_04925 [Clostridia bacterium]|nr:hypothetical protein [Clostridia bacterium]
MKNKIKKIAESIWTFIQATSALILLAFIFSLILFLAISAVGGALWLFDFLFLGGVIFG